MPEAFDNAAAAHHATSTSGQIAEAVADLFKSVASGMPTGHGGVVCRSCLMFGVLFFLLAVVGHDSNLKYGGGIGMVLCMGSILFFYGVHGDRSLAVGQEARAEQILGTK